MNSSKDKLETEHQKTNLQQEEVNNQFINPHIPASAQLSTSQSLKVQSLTAQSIQIPSQPSSTQSYRNSSPELEEILYKQIPVLDHGFIRVIDYMGNDASIVQAARVSYGAGTKKVNEDRGLINYLMRNHHTTPFEMCEIKLHVKLPIFVARQWIRHRTANVNEYSARYSVLNKEFYIPDQLHGQDLQNKQGSFGEIGNDSAKNVIDKLQNHSIKSYELYEFLLSETKERPPIAREIARMVLPVNFYTEWYWKIDLHNLLHFLRLRADAHAQFEIRQYAQIMLNEIVKKWVPFTYDAFVNFKVNNLNISNQFQNLIKRIFAGEDVNYENSNLSAGQWRDFCEKFDYKV